MTTKRGETATLDLSDLTRVRLEIGCHGPDGEACVMEAVSVYAGEPWSDRPATTDSAFAVYLRAVNDRSPQWVPDELALRIPRIARAHILPAETRWMWAEAARQSAIRALGPVHGAAPARCYPIVDRDTAYAVAADAADAAAVAADDAAAAAANAAAAWAADAHRSTAEWRQALALVDRMCDLATEAEP